MSGKERSQIRCEINVTPLIDVCLVLLIVFIVLVFDRPPQILFGPDFRWIRRDRFPAEVAALHEADPNRTILLRADRKLSYGDVKDVMRTLRDAGFRNVGLIAEKQSAPAGAR